MSGVHVTEPMIEVRGLRKRFGTVEALAGIDVTVARGELLGVLGPNGAGKTTMISALATLLQPDAGTCRVAGFDVVENPQAVRSVIGLTGQFAAVDDNLTARENLVLFGRLLKLGRAGARRRANELMERFELIDAADRRVEGFSGGMRRRLDLAASMIAEPPVLFLDEPTTGLDPRSRQALWDVVRGLQHHGVTIVLTTQYLEEADQLADRIVVIDHGQVIADGTPTELKQRVGGAVCHVDIDDEIQRAAAVEALSDLTAGVSIVASGITVPAESAGIVPDVIRRLDAGGIEVDDLSVHRPTLDDVFFALTGHAAHPDHGDDTTPGVHGERALAAGTRREVATS